MCCQMCDVRESISNGLSQSGSQAVHGVGETAFEDHHCNAGKHIFALKPPPFGVGRRQCACQSGAQLIARERETVCPRPAINTNCTWPACRMWRA